MSEMAREDNTTAALTSGIGSGIEALAKAVPASNDIRMARNEMTLRKADPAIIFTIPPKQICHAP
jgi:hypothetical protein